ncbi:MAG: hypothetical protein ACREF7_04760, partial [Candidatus Saccharimonadales bacterium]
ANTKLRFLIISLSLIAMLFLSSCGASWSKSEKLANRRVITYLKTTITQKTTIPWKIISINPAQYQMKNPLFKKLAPKVKVYDVRLQGGIEQPVCPKNAKKGSVCGQKIVKGTYLVVILQQQDKILKVSSSVHASMLKN